jgi:hypothetical protein
MSVSCRVIKVLASGYRRLVDRLLVGHNNLGTISEETASVQKRLTTPVVRIVRRGICSGPLSLACLTRSGGVGVCTWLTNVSQTKSRTNGGRLRHTGRARSSCSRGCSCLARETTIGSESILSVRVWLRHTIHRLGILLVIGQKTALDRRTMLP